MYISFVGFITEPENAEQLEVKFPAEYHEHFIGTDNTGEDCYYSRKTGFRDGLSYQPIGGQDSLTVYLAKIDENTGHLVASCPEGGWADDCFCLIDGEGMPVKDADNYNPNPVEQVI